MLSNLKLQNIIRIFRSELKNIFLDKGVALIMIGGIFLYGLFYTIPFSNHIAREIPIGVIDQDNSELSRKIIRNLNSNEMLKVEASPRDLEEAKRQYYEQKTYAFIVIPQDFEKDIKHGKNSFITTYTDSAYMIIYKQIASGINSVITEANATLVVNRLLKSGVKKRQRAMSVAAPFNFISVPLFNPIGSYQNYIYPLALIMILQQTMLLGIGMLGGTLREKLRGTVFRGENKSICFTMISRISEFSDNPCEIVLGKAFAYVALYFLYSIIYFLIFPAFVVYKMSYNIFLMLLLLIPFLLATAFLGQTLIAFCKNRESSLLILIISSVPFIFLPGFVWPKESIPTFIICIAQLIPTTSAIDGLVKINQMGADFSFVFCDFLILIVLCALYFFCACKTYRNLVT